MRHSLKHLERLITEALENGDDDKLADVGYWILYGRRHRFESTWAWWCWITGPLGLWPWSAWGLIRRARAMEAKLEAEKRRLADYIVDLGTRLKSEEARQSNNRPESES